MKSIKTIYKKLTALHWEIGILDNTYQDIVTGQPLKIKMITHNYPSHWFADPFIMEVTDDNIIILVEDVSTDCKKGRISKLIVDKASLHVIERKVILERPGHLSFPVIIRNDDKIFIMPENSADGSLNLYEYNPKNDEVSFRHKMCDRPLTDAIIVDYWGKRQLFATEIPHDNGFQLDQYEWDRIKEKYVFCQSITFNEHIARMAGEFFKINDKVYRPAQESNSIYGHGMSIQEVSYVSNTWTFNEIRRLISPISKMKVGFHTLNSYKNVLVVDVKGYRHPIIGPVLVNVVECIRKIISRQK